MKYILFFISTLVCVNISHAQIEKEFYSSGELMSEGKKIDGKKEGKWQHYYRNGQIEKIEHYRKDVLNGTFFSYYENGMLESKGNYKDGKEDGEFLMYFEDGSLAVKATANNGILVGEYIEYHESKKLLKKGTYKDGEEVGIWLKNEFYNNGNLKYELKILDGKMNGLCKDYYENGQLRSSGIMANDKPNGDYKAYYSDGQLREVGAFRFGKKHGTFKKYDEDGELESIKSYANDEKNGYWKYKNYSGDIEEGQYTNGKKSGNWKIYDDGNLEEEGEYLNDKRHGLWKFYVTNIHSKKTRITKKGIYRNGEKDGKWVHYNRDGNENQYTVFNNGKKISTVKTGIHYTFGKYGSSLFTNGEEHYKNNKLVKTIKYVIKNNKIVDKETWVNGVLVSKASKPKETFYRVYFKNKCREDISVAIRGVNLKTNQWESKGWYNINSNDEGYIYDTKNGIIYYYAESKSFRWYGNHKKSLRGKTYDFKQKIISKDGYGKSQIVITCK
ncbi:MAG: hypothetical protein CMB99_02040 [Flavobacteriaceae bacterium]|nr:hypothetical protein [Flavobacteriaceae bacterium]|tara:strand:- start:51914 stop:53413 length:1500 start_codon:yes stop_codon:yes gene_type:complete